MFVKQVKNAKLYTIGKGDDQIYVVHLWGSPYEMGFAHGKLLPDRMKGLVETFWSYMESEIVLITNHEKKKERVEQIQKFCILIKDVLFKWND